MKDEKFKPVSRDRDRDRDRDRGLLCMFVCLFELEGKEIVDVCEFNEGE